MNSKVKTTNEKYNPSEVEAKWQKVWEKEKIYSPDLDKAKKPFYNLMMFPYPSAEGMHVGNMYAFTGADVYGRFMRMRGNDVFEPIGLDGFGIHSENYAIKIGRHPKEQAKISEKNFYRQLHATGNGFDWSRKLETYDPNYYKWTQWLFIQLFKAGLAYRKKAPVNFCPSCKTVLADEQVVQKLKSHPFDKLRAKVKITTQSSKLSEDPRSHQRNSVEDKAEKIAVDICERCETEIEKRDLEQWFFRITKYADRLLANIDKLDWSEKVKIAQRQWIGKSEGARIKFEIVLDSGVPSGTPSLEQYSSSEVKTYIEVFTTRPDTLYGATFIVLSVDHPISASIRSKEVQDYIKQIKSKPEQERAAEEKEKTGVFTGLYTINPLNGQKIPVWIADYALMSFGTGALFGDAHDERDVVFAKKYGIPLKPTIVTGDKDRDKKIMNLEECYTGYGTLVNSGEFSGLTSQDAMKKVVETLIKKESGKAETTYHLRDWLISRQRYWGPPIPLVFCENCAVKIKNQKSKIKNGEYSKEEIENPGWIAVREKDLPVLLPDVKDWKPKGTGKSPLASVESFVNTNCPNCKGPAKRETDVSDTFLDSSWYFLRYLATEFDNVPFPISSNVILNSFQDLGSSGAKMLKQVQHDIKGRTRWLPVNMYIGGAEHSVLHLLYARFITMVLKDLGFIEFEEPFSRFYAHGLLIKEGAKMSKSKGNVVIPDEYITKYGADSLRMYLMFLGPFNQGGDFRDTGIEGMHRFLKRIWSLVISPLSLAKDQRPKTKDQLQMMHKTIKKVTKDLEQLRYNTAIAALMEYYNFFSKQEYVAIAEFKTFLKLLAPFTPHIAEELWEYVGGKFSIHQELFPKFNQNALRASHRTIAIQINGKLRDTVIVTDQASKNKNTIEQLASESDKVKKYLEAKTIKKVVYVEGKVINLVTE